jgi:hypothetical protein
VCIGVPLAIALQSDSQSSYLLLAVSVAAFGVLVFGGAVGAGLFILLRQAARLDAAFKPQGLAGKAYLLNGRQYHGLRGGRQVDAYFYRGPSLDLSLGAAVHTGLGVGSKSWLSTALAGAANQAPLETGDPAYASLNIFPVDETWSRALLAEPQAKAALLRLAANQIALEMRRVSLEPEAVRLHVRRLPLSAFTAENVGQWLNDLSTLAQTAESLPAPQLTAPPSGVTRQSRAQMNQYVFYAVMFIVVVLPVCLIAIGGLVYWIVSLR